VMRQQRPRDRRFLLPIAFLLMTSLSDTFSANASSLTATDNDRRWWPVNDDQGGPSINQCVPSPNGVDRSLHVPQTTSRILD